MKNVCYRLNCSIGESENVKCKRGCIASIEHGVHNIEKRKTAEQEKNQRKEEEKKETKFEQKSLLINSPRTGLSGGYTT